MELLAIFILGFLILRVTISLVNFFSGLHLPNKKPKSFPRVSILVPARNEEAAIGQLLESVEKIHYPDYEVIVCDDHSSDNTDEILNWFSGEDERVHWFLGEQLPDGWLGKNFACYQLAQKATGKYLIFLDADVELSRDAITRAVAFFQKKNLSLLSVFPQQKMESLAEWMIVPVMNWILQSLLPMMLAEKTSFPSLSAANGQFMMFERENYHQYQWHSRVKNQPVEDIRLARMVKSQGLKMTVLLGSYDIYCRMYHHWGEAVQGFSRNIHEYFGGSRWLMTLFGILVICGPFVVWVAMGGPYLLLFIALVIFNRFLVALAARQNIFWSLLLHPVHMISFVAIAFNNILRRIKKETTWKGRKINLQA